MQEPWIYSSTFLPYTGEPIEFLLEAHDQPIHGTFDNGVFHSRWADYAAERVASWRDWKTGHAADHPGVSLAVPAVSNGSFLTRLKRLAGMLSHRRVIVPIVILRDRSRTPFRPANPASTSVTTSPDDSHQVSS
ncbi:MAG: hypothetical protein ABI365_02910 [Lysobacteraceae bacterium]